MKTLREWVIKSAQDAGLPAHEIDEVLQEADVNHPNASIKSFEEIPDAIGEALCEAGTKWLAHGFDRGGLDKQMDRAAEAAIMEFNSRKGEL